MARTLLLTSSTPQDLWAEAVLTSVYIINLLPTPTLNWDTPHKRLYGHSPSYSSLRVFGCSCFPYLGPLSSNKLSNQSVECVFIGYSPHHKGYRCLDPQTNRVYISRHVLFNENDFPYTRLQVPTNSAPIEFVSLSLPPQAQLPSPWSSPSASGPSPQSQSTRPITQSGQPSTFGGAAFNSFGGSSSFPVVADGKTTVMISEDSYQSGLARCKHMLLGRLQLGYNDKPYVPSDLHKKLTALWGDVGNWKLIPMGKGYYAFSFASEDCVSRVWGKGAVFLKPGMLRLMRWVPNFSPANQRNMNAQVWVKFWDLGLEFWEPTTLFEIAHGIGAPIKIDENTLQKRFGHYARVLVDIDLSFDPPHELVIKRTSGETLGIIIEYERLPNVCSHCGNVGHRVNSCKFVRNSIHVHREEDVPQQGRGRSRNRSLRRRRSRPKQVYVPKKALEGTKPDAGKANAGIDGQLVAYIPVKNNFLVLSTGDEGEASEQEDLNINKSKDDNDEWGVDGSDKDDNVVEQAIAVQGNEENNDRVLRAFASSQHVMGGSVAPFNPNTNWFDESEKEEENEFIEVVTFQVVFDSINCVLTAVYARTSIVERRRLWLDIEDIKCRFVSGPWIVVGDFNAVLGAHEKKGGAPVSRLSCEEFQAMSDICELIHVDTKGAQFTWARRRGVRGNVELRLDRCLVNLHWLDSWDSFTCSTLPRLCSDHNPLLITFSKSAGVRRSRFRFQKMWLEHKDFHAFVKLCWGSSATYGCPLTTLQHKLRVLRKALRSWNWEVFGDVNRRVDHALAELEALQLSIANSGGSEVDFARKWSCRLT
ncbi:hypothetical protein ACLB2K_052319 [Fragaria x ananassa]